MGAVYSTHTSFQSTPPVWGATSAGRRPAHTAGHFNPRPPCGGRLHPDTFTTIKKLFQSTPPVWGATASSSEVSVFLIKFQSTPPVWGATASSVSFAVPLLLFQSTPHVWGATPAYSGAGCWRRDFNPRPPCGGRQQKQLKIQSVLVKNRQFLQISSSNSYPILKNKVASLQIILQNLVRDLGDFLRAYVSHLKHQYIFWVVGCLYSKMLDLVFIAVSQVIKTKTVLFRVHDLTQLCL